MNFGLLFYAFTFWAAKRVLPLVVVLGLIFLSFGISMVYLALGILSAVLAFGYMLKEV